MVKVDRTEVAQLVRDLRNEAASYSRQWMLWLGLASGGGIVALLSFAANLPNPDHALRLLLPGLASFALGVTMAGASLLLATLRVRRAEEHHGAAFTRDELDDAIRQIPPALSSPQRIADEMNAPRNRLIRQREEYHAEAELSWRWHVKWKLAHRATLFVSTISFVFGAVWPLALIATGRSFVA